MFDIANDKYISMGLNTYNVLCLDVFQKTYITTTVYIIKI